MTTYSIPGPDGKSYSIDGPPGQSRDQVIEQIKKRLASQESGSRQQPESSAAGDFFKSIPTGFVEGLASTASASGQAAQAEMGDQGPAVPGAQQSAQIVQKEVTGPLHQPEGVAGRIGQGFGQALGTPTTYMGPGSAMMKAGTALTATVGSEALGQLGEGTPGAEVPLRMLGGALGGGIPAGITAAGRSIMSPKTVVAADLSRAMQRDGDTIDSLSGRLYRTRVTNPSATLADVAGENVRGIVERVAQTPGVGRSIVIPALTAQQKGQAGRLAEGLSTLTGTRQSAFRATQETMGARAHAASPLYRTSYQEGDFAIWSPELERLSSSPTVKSAMQGAVRIWRDNVIADGYGAMNPGALVDRGGILSFLSGKVPVFPNLQFWDYTKRRIDDQISAAIRAGQNQKVRTLTALNNQLRTELDAHVPSFRNAREAWGGPSQYLDAIEDGRNILSNNIGAEELRANLSQMTQAQQEGYRIGAVSSIISKFRGDPAKMPDLTKYLRSPETRDKISAIMPTQEAAAAFQQRLDFEVSKSELTGRALGNSATARRQAEKDAADGIAGDLILTALAHPTTLGLLKSSLMALPKRVRDTLRSRSDGMLAELLVTPEGAERLPRAVEGKVPQRGVVPASAARGAAIGASQGILDQQP